VTPQTRAKWQARVDAWVSSGKSNRTFAAESGLNPRSLSWWKWKLGTAAPSERKASAVPEFIEVTDEIMTTAIPNISEEPTIELVVGDVEIRLRGGVEAKMLSRVLDVLEDRR